MNNLNVSVILCGFTLHYSKLLCFKPIFRPIKRLKVIRSLSPERSSNVYSVLSGENSTATIITFCTVSFETVASGLGDVSNNRLKCAYVSGNTLPFNYNV